LTVLLAFAFPYIALGMKPRFWLDRLLLIAGALLLAVYAGIRVDGFIHSRAQLRAFQAHEVGGRAAPGKSHLPNGSTVEFSLGSPERVEEYQQAFLLNSRTPVAILRIPRIGLEVPVLEGTNKVNLNRGVGCIVGTVRPLELGNIGIAGHRDGFFRGLKEIMPGDVVELESNSVNANYAVDDIEIVDPSDSAVLLPRSKPAITMVTCYPFYFIGNAPNRFIVHASLTQVIPAATAQVASDDATAKNN
jgi:sortase A